jgi:MFS superfamily sulfate permease-like transporter
MTSPAVVAGMLSGIGILIVASQSHVLMDAAPKARGLENFAALPAVLWQALDAGVGRAALLVGLGTIAIMLAWERLRPQRLRFVPGALLAVVAMTALVQLQGMDVRKVDVPANLFSAIQTPTLAEMLGVFDATLLLSAFTFAFIASAETLLSAAAVDRMHEGPRTDYDRELAAQGVGNMLCGFLGALPMTGVIVRSAAPFTERCSLARRSARRQQRKAIGRARSRTAPQTGIRPSPRPFPIQRTSICPRLQTARTDQAASCPAS